MSKPCHAADAPEDVLASESLKLQIWPIAAGMLADTIGTVVFGILYLSVVLGEKMSSGQPLEELKAEALLQRTDLMADRGRREVQLGGRR